MEECSRTRLDKDECPVENLPPTRYVDFLDHDVRAQCFVTC